MKILVLLRRILDPEAEVQIISDDAVETIGKKTIINPFDEVALEAAVSLKEAGHASEVIAVTFGEKHAQETLRQALAAQANRAIWIKCPDNVSDWEITDNIVSLIQREFADIFICGKQCADKDACLLAQLIASQLDWPQIISATKLSCHDSKIIAQCDSINGIKEITVLLPAVVAVDLMLCKPRFISLGNILKAKKSPIEVLSPDDLKNSKEDRPSSKTIIFSYPAPHNSCLQLSSVDELIQTISDIVGK